MATMEQIIPQRVERKLSKNNKPYTRVQDDKGRWLSCWLDKVIQDKIQEGSPIQIEIATQGDFQNIIRIGYPQQVQQPQPQPQPIQSTPQPIQSQPQPQKTAPPISSPSQLKEELKTSSGNILIRIGALVNEITRNTQALTEELLTRKELELSGENFNLSKLYAVQYNKTKVAEAEYKKNLDEMSNNLKINKEISATEAKKQAEQELWDEKIKLVTARNTLTSHQTILDSVKYILLAIKDRLKYLRQ